MGDQDVAVSAGFAIPEFILESMLEADLSWREILKLGIDAVMRSNPSYLSTLTPDNHLPTAGRLFAAFKQPLQHTRYVLIGEGPYPRPESATGFAFMDGAVNDVWSATGLSKQVNRATSLRNFFKMLLVAEGRLAVAKTSGDALADIAAEARSLDTRFIQTLDDLQANLLAEGFLLLNASLVYRSTVPAIRDAKAWQPFLQQVLKTLVNSNQSKKESAPTLVLWGKIAGQVAEMEALTCFPKIISEHPYNLSFIANSDMHALFAPMRLLEKHRS